jgi:hypothetical protein
MPSLRSSTRVSRNAHGGPRTAPGASTSSPLSAEPHRGRYFPSLDDLLDAVAEDERRTFEAGIAAAVRDHPPGARLDAVLHFMSAAFSNDYLQQLVITEPEFVRERFVSILPRSAR